MASLFFRRCSFAMARFNKYCCNNTREKLNPWLSTSAFLIQKNNYSQQNQYSTIKAAYSSQSYSRTSPRKSNICCCNATNYYCYSANQGRPLLFFRRNTSSKTSSGAATRTIGKKSSKSAWLLVLGGLAGLGGLAVWQRSKKADGSQEDPLTMTVKRGVLATQRGQYKEAQDFFHKALEMAHIKHKEKIIDDQQLLLIQVNIFGLMATAATKSGDFENAEKLYKETMKKCIAAGRSPDDESVIELSVKLASLYAMTSRDKEAQTGLLYCVEKMEEKVKEQGGILEADTNTLALLGLSLQSLARFYMKKKESVKGIDCYKRSLDIAREVYGANHPQALVVLNDLASAHVISKQFKEGIECYREAVERAEQAEDMGDSLVAFHYNLGETYILLKDFETATSHCVQCIEKAKSLSNSQLVRAGEQCLKDVEEEKAKLHLVRLKSS